jgi:hypothetical protein
MSTARLSRRDHWPLLAGFVLAWCLMSFPELALDERVRTGVWPDTSPAAMNARARAIDPGAAPVFVAYENEKFARPFFLGDVYRLPEAQRPRD